MAKGKHGFQTTAHTRIDLRLLQCPAFIALPATAVKLYMDMRSALRASNNGNISATLCNLVHRGWASPTTLAKSLRQLEAAGFIRKTRLTTGVHMGSRICNLYRFTDQESFEFPKLCVDAYKASHDYLNFKSLSEAKVAITAASAPKAKKMTLHIA